MLQESVKPLKYSSKEKYLFKSYFTSTKTKDKDVTVKATERKVLTREARKAYFTSTKKKVSKIIQKVKFKIGDENLANKTASLPYPVSKPVEKPKDAGEKEKPKDAGEKEKPKDAGDGEA